MKKFVISAIAVLISLGCITTANAAAGDNTFSIGYAQTHSNSLKNGVNLMCDMMTEFGGHFDDYKDPKGINFKFRHEFDDHLGLIASLTHTNEKFSGDNFGQDPDSYGYLSAKRRYFSFMAGPTLRLNEYVSAYATAGVAYTKANLYGAEYSAKKDASDNITGYDVVNSLALSDHKTSFAYGIGLQFNPFESVAIDVSYEGSGSGDWRTNGFNVGVGYKF
ncbi:Ail/Lom family outer membrane beta-barrel protein [Yersinia kristensenii]|nr:Ail/Lom family outer membrane beta-barrel protein [Yersinia kristensenii]MBW5814613.1 Ail/Lom family outer membrane beta-barrel protein [Yersinia kristensenii]